MTADPQRRNDRDRYAQLRIHLRALDVAIDQATAAGNTFALSELLWLRPRLVRRLSDLAARLG